MTNIFDFFQGEDDGPTLFAARAPRRPQPELDLLLIPRVPAAVPLRWGAPKDVAVELPASESRRSHTGATYDMNGGLRIDG
jgi:hypothetical protein